MDCIVSSQFKVLVWIAEHITPVFQWGSGIKTHSLGGACIGYTGSELQLYVVYCTHIELIKKFTETVIQ